MYTQGSDFGAFTAYAHKVGTLRKAKAKFASLASQSSKFQES